MNNLFECKVMYTGITGDGKEKIFRENYLVDAMSFTEAEARTVNNLESFISGEFRIKAIKESNYNELILENEGDTLYKASVSYIAINEETGREKLSKTYILVRANNIEEANEILNTVLIVSITECVINGIVDSKLKDYFPASE